MRRIRLQIDISGTKEDEAWSHLNQFADIVDSRFGPDEGSGGPCRHASADPHLRGEWWGAVVMVDNNFLAEYALPHYLEQSRVIDAYIEQQEDGP